MDDEVKQRIIKYADTAFAAAYHTSLLKAKHEIAAALSLLAKRGLILSGETIVRVAQIQGDHINTVVQAKADALLDAYELYGAEIDNFIQIEANQLRWTMIDSLSQNDQTACLPPGVPAFEMFKPQLVTNTGAIINSIECQIERRKLIPKLKQDERVKRSETSSIVDEDRRFAQMAIEEARKSVPEDGRAHPKVGAIIVKDGRVVSKAHRGENPKCHAEYIALENKLPDDLIAGATVYTTLEPCTTRNHPKIPCAKRLIERKVARVVIGMLDPNPDIRGIGEQLLSEANIETQLFPRDLKAQVEELNREFIREQKQRQPKKLVAEMDAPSAENALRGDRVSQRVRILNSDGSAEPIRVTGKQQSAHDASLTVLWALIRVVTYTQYPVTITIDRLVLDGKHWPVTAMFFQQRTNIAVKERAITVIGNHAQDYRLNFIFPMQQCPETKSGVLFLQIDSSGELALNIQFP